MFKEVKRSLKGKNKTKTVHAETQRQQKHCV